MNYNEVFNKIAIPLRSSLFPTYYVFTIVDTDKLNALNNFSDFLAMLLSNGKVRII